MSMSPCLPLTVSCFLMSSSYVSLHQFHQRRSQIPCCLPESMGQATFVRILPRLFRYDRSSGYTFERLFVPVVVPLRDRPRAFRRRQPSLLTSSFARLRRQTTSFRLAPRTETECKRTELDDLVRHTCSDRIVHFHLVPIDPSVPSFRDRPLPINDVQSTPVLPVGPTLFKRPIRTRRAKHGRGRVVGMMYVHALRRS